MGQPDPTRNPIDPTRPTRFAMSNQNSRPNGVYPQSLPFISQTCPPPPLSFFFFFKSNINFKY